MQVTSDSSVLGLIMVVVSGFLFGAGFCLAARLFWKRGA